MDHTRQDSPAVRAGNSVILVAFFLLVQWLALGAILYAHYYVTGWKDALGWSVIGALVAAVSGVLMFVSSLIGRSWRGRPIDRFIFWLQMPTGIPVLCFTLWGIGMWIIHIE